MTVQTIDKRVAAEANMTPVTQDKSQAATSVEDAFVALLQQTSQRYGNKAAGQAAPDKVLADHFSRAKVEIRTDKAQAAKDEGQPDRGPTAKEPRAVGKADKPRPAAASAPAPKATPKADAPAASVASADDGEQTQAVADDDSPAAGQGDAKAKAQEVETVAVAVQQQVMVEIDIEVTETVQVVAANASTQIAGAGEQQAADAKDPLAGLNKEDRQRVVDLEKRIIQDLENGDAEDALDAATELVSQLIGKAGQQQTEGVQDAGHHHEKTDLAKQQADTLSSMLAGSTAQVSVQVEVKQAASDAPLQVAAVLAETQIQTEMSAQGQQNAGQGQQQNAGADTAASGQAVQLGAQQPLDQLIDDIKTFSAVLAAQVEANAQEAKAAPDAKPLAGIAAVGQAQAAEKSGASQAAQGPRAPRVPLQQQVMEQVSVQIDKAVKDGADTVKIQLRPHDLGRIEIKLDVVDGHVSATVTAEKPETLALLQKDAKGLEKALEDAGLKPDSSATSFSLKNGDQQQNADRGNNNGSRKGRGRDNDMADEAVVIAAEATQPRRAGGRTGVDISV